MSAELRTFAPGQLPHAYTRCSHFRFSLVLVPDALSCEHGTSLTKLQAPSSHSIENLKLLYVTTCRELILSSNASNLRVVLRPSLNMLKPIRPVRDGANFETNPS